jgi:hypothetical protein
MPSCGALLLAFQPDACIAPDSEPNNVVRVACAMRRCATKLPAYFCAPKFIKASVFSSPLETAIRPHSR